MKIIVVVITSLIIVSCENRTNKTSVKEISGDSVAAFSKKVSMTFVSTNTKDQIALLLWKDSADIFKYRIELLRKWRGLPHDYGDLKLERHVSDSSNIYLFTGGNSDCTVVLRMYGLGRVGIDYATLERDCKNNSLDIALDEFEKLTFKGGQY